MRIHVLKHIELEDIGCIKDWAIEKGYSVSYTRQYNGDSLPMLDSFDFLIVMGGPMGVYDTDKYNWLESELKFIFTAIDANKFVLGICLGSQFIAKALGAEVYSSGTKEIGWYNITLSHEAKETGLFDDCDNEFKVLHWHGDTFCLPAGAKLLMSSEAFPNQGFMFRDNVLAFQFHIEIGYDNVVDFVNEFRDELVADTFVQDEKTILENRDDYQKNNAIMFNVLNSFIDRA